MNPHAAELLELARLADQEKPFIKEKLRRLNEAAAVPGPAGALCRAIHQGPMHICELERASGVKLAVIGGFLEGEEISLSDFEHMALALGLELSLVHKPTPAQQPVAVS